MPAISVSGNPATAPQWAPVELAFEAQQSWPNPYTDVSVWVDFHHESGRSLRRPAFWDGGQTWRVRFSSPLADGLWKWSSAACTDDAGLAGRTGTLRAQTAADPGSFLAAGLLKMSPEGRNVVRADGRALMLLGDTAWAIPWRATVEECEEYARDRSAKGFSMALLMTVQPDLHTIGPEDRTQVRGFDRAFEDLPTGHVNRLRPSYFQYLDRLVKVLLRHGIIPVYQPVFHGYGWKGGGTAGGVVPPEEYARYCRYLVARYGAWPALYLVGADGSGREPTIEAGGVEVETWDCYGQPTGIHYAPNADDQAHQDAAWLDFQWCQTGHHGEHRPEKVAVMRHHQPPKAVANGEPSYERMGANGHLTSGWWQGHEAWSNLCAGGTMCVVYGAGSLWNWPRVPDEPGMQAWTLAAGCDWRQALSFEGSRFVGIVSRIFTGQDFADMEPDPSCTCGVRSLIAPGRFFLLYVENPSPQESIPILAENAPSRYRIWNLREGTVIGEGQLTSQDRSIRIDTTAPVAVVFSES